MRYPSVFLSLFLLIFVISCQVEELLDSDVTSSTEEDLYPNVDLALEPYFQNFEREALERGLRVDLSAADITGTIEEIHEDDIAGTCSYNRFGLDKEIIIDESFWNRASSFYREYIIFHELGHCYLDRDHLDACLQEGIWSSLMRSGTIDGCSDYYNQQTREYYLDELFSSGL